ncbi:hypothetical protein G6L32_26645 [Agrobacterium tumefaciens]|uniref:hypothetical protein n=1 Tax=Agrobacterium tumefaciens TaxID=358 RepID=UPI000DD3F9B4|nr:hypothetical protein [Agrobacterium tumefaciens]
MSRAFGKLIKKLEKLEAQMSITCDLEISSEARQKILSDLLEQHRLIGNELMVKGFREKLEGSEELAARIFCNGSALSKGDQ